MSSTPKRLRVLIVEDEFILARFLRRALAERGHVCTAVNSGAIAMTTMQRETFDVVMSDMRLGREDGAAVLERARDLLPMARRVLMTGALDPDVAARLVADVVLFKPFTLVELLEAIEAEEPAARS